MPNRQFYALGGAYKRIAALEDGGTGGVRLTNADPSGVNDSTTAFQTASAKAIPNGNAVVVPPGRYKVSDRLHSAITASRFILAAEIPGTVTIERTTAVTLVEVAGTKSATTTISADVVVGASTITLNALPAGGLVADDYVELDSKVLFATGVGSTAATVAEIVRVKTVAGTGPYTITLYGPTEEAYLTANVATLCRVDFGGIGSGVYGITMRQTAQNRDGAGFPLVRYTNVRGVTVERSHFRDADVPGVEMKGVIHADIVAPYFENLTDNIGGGFIGYGVNLGGNCRDIRIERPVGRWVRHVVTTGWGTGDVGVPRHITIANGHSYETTAGGWNTHKEGKFVTFANCESHNDKNYGFYIRSPFTTITNPTVVNPGTGTTHAAIKFAENEAGDGQINGGKLLLSANSFSGIHVESARLHVMGTRIYGPGGNGANLTIEASGLDCMFDNVYSFNPFGQHFRWTSSAATGCVVRNPIPVGGTTKYITSFVTAGQGRVIGQASAGNNLFAIDQNQRALTDFQYTIRNISSSTSLNDIDGTAMVDCTGAARTISLPTPTAAFVGKEFRIIKKDASANAVTINATGGSTVFGVTSLATQGAAGIATCDGTNWYVK